MIDRGPFIAGRTFDLTIATARLIGFPLAAGVATIHWRKCSQHRNGGRVINLGIRIANASLLLELNGWWLSIDIPISRRVTVEFGHVKTGPSELVAQDQRPAG